MKTDSSPADFLYRFFRLFTVIHRGEGLTVFLLALNVFLLLSAYYIIKPVREALILAGKGAEMKSYLAAAQAILFILVVKAFSGLASKIPRQTLITWVTLFFISNLVLFYALYLAGVSLGTMGIIFFVWVGIFNIMVVAQFWAFSNDIYSHEAGKRLFPLIMFGANVGAFLGAKVASWLVVPLGVYQMMLVAGAILVVCIGLTRVVHRRETVARPAGPMDAAPAPEEDKEKPLAKGGGFRLLFNSRYLLLIAGLILLLNLVNTTGEYILGKVIVETAEEAVRTGQAAGVEAKELIGGLYADFYFWVNLLTMAIQLLLVSRIYKRFGVRGALFFLPLIAFGGYLFVALGASFLIVRWAKTAENAVDYSLMNTNRHALFLVVSREAKYKAKVAVDTFVVRAGDVLSALLVFVGTTYLAFNVEKFAVFNVAVAVVWIVLCVLIAREHKRLAAAAPEPGSAGPPK